MRTEKTYLSCCGFLAGLSCSLGGGGTRRLSSCFPFLLPSFFFWFIFRNFLFILFLFISILVNFLLGLLWSWWHLQSEVESAQQANIFPRGRFRPGS